MENLKMYSQEEQQEAILTYGQDLTIKVNGDFRLLIKSGDKVTLLGEYTIRAAHDHTQKLRQFIIATDNGVFSIFEQFAKIVPKEKLELGDFVSIEWEFIKEEGEYIVSYDADKHYHLRRINDTNCYAFARNHTLEELLKTIQEKKYEIKPKGEYTLTVTKR